MLNKVKDSKTDLETQKKKKKERQRKREKKKLRFCPQEIYKQKVK